MRSNCIDPDATSATYVAAPAILYVASFLGPATIIWADASRFTARGPFLGLHMSDCFKVYGLFAIENKQRIVDREHQNSFGPNVLIVKASSCPIADV